MICAPAALKALRFLFPEQLLTSARTMVAAAQWPLDKVSHKRIFSI